MKRVVVALLAGSALAAAAAGAAPRQAAAPHEPGWDHLGPLWSPDGGRILYGRVFVPPKAGKRLRLVVMRSSGGGHRQVEPPSAGEVEQGRWSPDGRKIVFQRWDAGTEGRIMVSDTNGRGVRRLTSDPASWDSDPAWSPDGSLIAFRRSKGGDSLYVMGADGSRPRRLTSGGAPVWSPDGRSIAFVRRGPGGRGSDVYVVRLDGSGLRRLTEGRQWNTVDGWSPDGATLLVERSADQAGEAEQGLWTMRVDGSRKRRLGAGAGASFSPDGTRIVFHRWLGRGASRRSDVLVMTSDGRDGRVVFRGGRGASWSPDGKLLALGARGPCLGWGIYVVRFLGGGARRLTNDCRIVGTAGSDVLAGTRERDVVHGLAGDDVVRANPADRGPIYFGRLDDDLVDGGSGNDRIWGGRGTDVLLGGDGNDIVDGGRFSDRLSGGRGSDLILARDAAIDRIACGPGRDRVVADPGDVVAADCEAVAR